MSKSISVSPLVYFRPFFSLSFFHFLFLYNFSFFFFSVISFVRHYLVSDAFPEGPPVTLLDEGEDVDKGEDEDLEAREAT